VTGVGYITELHVGLYVDFEFYFVS